LRPYPKNPEFDRQMAFVNWAKAIHRTMEEFPVEDANRCIEAGIPPIVEWFVNHKRTATLGPRRTTPIPNENDFYLMISEILRRFKQ
jgi:hypothetical protein